MSVFEAFCGSMAGLSQEPLRRELLNLNELKRRPPHVNSNHIPAHGSGKAHLKTGYSKLTVKIYGVKSLAIISNDSEKAAFKLYENYLALSAHDIFPAHGRTRREGHEKKEREK